MWASVKGLLRLARSQTAMAIIAVASILLAVYQTWFYERPNEFLVEAVSVARVIDIREPLSGLDVLYRGQSLRQQGEDLSIAVIQFRNTGRTTLTKSDFDERDQLGIAIKPGRILDVSLSNASNSYIGANVRITATEDTVRVAPLILDAGDFLSVRLLVVAPQGQKIAFSPLGKIAGIKTLSISDTPTQQANRTFIERVADADSWTVHLARFFGYLIVGLLLIFLILGATFTITFQIIDPLRDLPKKKRRRNLVREYSRHRSLTVADQVVLGEFEAHGKSALHRLYAVLEKTRRRNDMAEKLSRACGKEEASKLLERVDPIGHLLGDFLRRFPHVATVADDQVQIDREMESGLDAFWAFLKQRDESVSESERDKDTAQRIEQDVFISMRRTPHEKSSSDLE